MIQSGRVRKTLKYLDEQYQGNLTDPDVHKPVLYAKMAVLEYCGWLEASFDDIARNCVRKTLRTKALREVLEDKISNTYGFTYKANVRPMLAYGLGVIKLRSFEIELDRDGTLQRLKSELGSMNTLRREAAHTFTNGATSTYPSPNIIIGRLNTAEPILRRMWAKVSP